VPPWLDDTGGPSSTRANATTESAASLRRSRPSGMAMKEAVREAENGSLRCADVSGWGAKCTPSCTDRRGRGRGQLATYGPAYVTRTHSSLDQLILVIRTKGVDPRRLRCIRHGALRRHILRTATVAGPVATPSRHATGVVDYPNPCRPKARTLRYADACPLVMTVATQRLTGQVMGRQQGGREGSAVFSKPSGHRE